MRSMRNRVIAALGALLALSLIGGFAFAQSQRSASVEVVVWQSAADGSRLHLSTRAEGGRWRTDGAPLSLTPSASGRFLRSGIVAITAPVPPAVAPRGVGTIAVARMAGPDGAELGTVTIEQGPQGLIIAADVRGLSPGGHGFHIHETGSCEPDFAAAGDHFNPTGASHGARHGPGRHAGDLPNLYAAADGGARADVFTDAATLDAGEPHSLFDADGSAVIIHALPDTYGEDAGAGGRVACGVIRIAEDADIDDSATAE